MDLIQEEEEEGICSERNLVSSQQPGEVVERPLLQLRLCKNLVSVIAASLEYSLECLLLSQIRSITNLASTKLIRRMLARRSVCSSIECSHLPR